MLILNRNAASMHPSMLLIALLVSGLPSFTQNKGIWTEENRKFLIDNLERTKSEIIQATENPTPQQWSLKKTVINGPLPKYLNIWAFMKGYLNRKPISCSAQRRNLN